MSHRFGVHSWSLINQNLSYHLLLTCKWFLCSVKHSLIWRSFWTFDKKKGYHGFKCHKFWLLWDIKTNICSDAVDMIGSCEFEFMTCHIYFIIIIMPSMNNKTHLMFHHFFWGFLSSIVTQVFLRTLKVFYEMRPCWCEPKCIYYYFFVEL